MKENFLITKFFYSCVVELRVWRKVKGCENLETMITNKSLTLKKNLYLNLSGVAKKYFFIFTQNSFLYFDLYCP